MPLPSAEIVAPSAPAVNLIFSGTGLYRMADGRTARVAKVNAKTGVAIGIACWDTEAACPYAWWLDGEASSGHSRFDLMEKL